MPPLIHLVTAWLVGAFSGSTEALGGQGIPTLSLVVGVAGGVIGWCRGVDRRTTALVCTIVAVVAAASARLSAHQQRVCRVTLAAVLARGDTVDAVFDDDARRGASRAQGDGPVRGLAAGRGRVARCRVPVIVRVVSGHALAGQWVALSGRALVTTRGLRVDARLTSVRPARRDIMRVARGRAGAIIDRDFGANSPVVRALLIADQDGIAPSVREVFADAGLVHMLSISGLHVAIIAGALLLVLRAARLTRTVAFAVSMIVVVLYVVMLGAPPPAVRSAVMLGVVGLSERLQRPTHPWTALALGALLPTVQPTVVLDLGWQLSVSGMAALVAARALLRRVRLAERRQHRRSIRRVLSWVQELRGWRYVLLRELVTGTVATIVTAPLIAWTFGRISVIAPISNLLASPLVAFVQPALFLSVITSPWPALSKLIADATAPGLAALQGVAEYAARIPHATLHLAPTAAGAICAGVASAAGVRATASRRWLPGFAVAAGALTCAIWLPLLGLRTGHMEMHVLDVGQGDAIALRTPRGRWLLIDAGRRWEGGDAGRRTVVPYVRRLGGPVAGLVVTHAHDDHIGGALSVLQALSPRAFWEPAFVTPNATYRATLDFLRRTALPWHRVQPGDRWVLDDVEIGVLAPDSAWTARQQDANETSVVLRIRYGAVVFLLTGDAERAEEEWILANTERELLRADVLKVGHHGSKTSSSEAFLDAVQPRLGVVSVGAANSYGHPSPSTLRAFADRSIPLLRTDSEGTVVFSTDGRDLVVRTGAERWVVPPR